MNFYDFWHEHYFLAFCAIWFTAWLINSLAKWLVILIRGWPPEEF